MVVRLCALSVRSTTSTAPTVAGSSVAETRASKLPSAPRTRTPCSCIARRCAPRAISVTSSPAFANMAPTNAPIAPAPTMAKFMTTQECFRTRLIQLMTFRVRTASGSDRINQGRSNQRGRLHDPVATARGSDTLRPRCDAESCRWPCAGSLPRCKSSSDI